MTKKENIYQKNTVRFDGFSLSNSVGKFCATSAFGVRTTDGKLTLGAGKAYLSIDGVDVCVPEGEKAVSLGFLPKGSSSGAYNSPVLSTNTGVWYYADAQRAFRKLLSSGDKARFLLFPKKRREMPIGIVLSASLWTYDEVNWVAKAADGDFRGAVCVYSDRLFSVDSDNRLNYSASFDYANFNESADEGGYLFVTDKADIITQLLPLEKEMYLLTGRHLFRLIGGGAARDFVLEKVDYAGGRILKGSGATAGDGVVFVASDGVYFVKKGQVKRISTDVNSTKLLCLGEGSVSEMTYYLPCQINDEKKTLALDLQSGEYTFTHYDSLLCAYDGEVFGVEETGRIFALCSGYPSSGARFVRKGENFGNGFDKTLKNIRLYGEGEASITVSGRNGVKQATVRLSPEGVQIPILLKGKAFDIVLSVSVNGSLTALEGDTVQLID